MNLVGTGAIINRYVFQYPLCRIVGVNYSRFAPGGVPLNFQYPLCRIVGVNRHIRRSKSLRARFQYPLCRIVGVN